MSAKKSESSPSFSRRRFLLLASGIAMASALYLKRHEISLHLPAQRRREKLLRLVSHLGHARNVGMVYLEYRASEKSLTKLLDAIQHDLGMDLLGQTQTDLADAVTRLIRSDYRRHRVVDVGGWILSVTESRLAALVVAR